MSGVSGAQLVVVGLFPFRVSFPGSSHTLPSTLRSLRTPTQLRFPSSGRNRHVLRCFPCRAIRFHPIDILSFLSLFSVPSLRQQTSPTLFGRDAPDLPAPHTHAGERQRPGTFPRDVELAAAHEPRPDANVQLGHHKQQQQQHQQRFCSWCFVPLQCLGQPTELPDATSAPAVAAATTPTDATTATPTDATTTTVAATTTDTTATK